MNYQEMLNRAEKFNEMLELHNKKPHLIKESEQLIRDLNAEIENLEKDGVNQALNQSLNKLNPKRFLFKKPAEEVDAEELILKKELKVRKENKKIESLKNTRTHELISLKEVGRECADILAEKQKDIESMIPEIESAREQYHALLDKYNEEIDLHNKFAMSAAGKINEIAREGFIPKYHGDTPPNFSRPVSTISMAAELIRGHRVRPNREGTLHS